MLRYDQYKKIHPGISEQIINRDYIRYRNNEISSGRIKESWVGYGTISVASTWDDYMDTTTGYVTFRNKSTLVETTYGDGSSPILVSITVGEYLVWSSDDSGNLSGDLFMVGSGLPAPQKITKLEVDGWQTTLLILIFNRALTTTLTGISGCDDLFVLAMDESPSFEFTTSDIPSISNPGSNLVLYSYGNSTLDLSTFVDLPYLELTSSVLDTVIFHPTNVPLSQNYSCSSFTSAVVNSILADMVASGQSGLSIALAGDCAAPTGQGLTDKSTLISNGWSVTTN